MLSLLQKARETYRKPLRKAEVFGKKGRSGYEKYSICRSYGFTLTVWLSAAGIVKSESSERTKEEHYAALEQQYVEDVREYLNKTGYPDSGVMCNRVTYEDGRREYTVFLHHRRLAGLAEEEKEALVQELLQKAMEEEAFQKEEVSFTFSIS